MAELPGGVAESLETVEQLLGPVDGRTLAVGRADVLVQRLQVGLLPGVVIVACAR